MLLRHTRPRLLAAALVLALAGALAGCGSSGSPSATSAAASAASAGHGFPVTLTNAFGKTTIRSAPKRVVAIGWSDQDDLLALGVVPVAVPEIGAFKDGVGPWAAPLLKGARPQVINFSGDSISYEKVAALHPDLIVAVASGITAANYARLSEIAPTVAFPKAEGNFLVPWQTQAEIIGQAVGKATQAKHLVSGVYSQIATLRKQYPQLVGKTFAEVGLVDTTGSPYVYTAPNARNHVLERLGLKLDPAVARIDGGANYAVQLSSERVSALSGNMLLAWSTTPAAEAAFLKNPVAHNLAVIKHGGLVAMDPALAQAQGAPSLLSIPWALKELAPRMAKAVTR